MKIILLISLLLLASCSTHHECEIEAINECWIDNVKSTTINWWLCRYTCKDYSKYFIINQ